MSGLENFVWFLAGYAAGGLASLIWISCLHMARRADDAAEAQIKGEGFTVK